MWLRAIGLWTLGCALLLFLHPTFNPYSALMALAGICGSVAWLYAGAVAAVRRRWTRRFLLTWFAWPLAVGLVALLYVTDLPFKARVCVSAGFLADFAGDARDGTAEPGLCGLFWVRGYQVRDGCVFLEMGESLDGITGIAQAAEGSEPPNHPQWAATDFRHLTGPWWYFETRT